MECLTILNSTNLSQRLLSRLTEAYLGHLLAVSLGVEGSLGQEDGVLLGGNTQFIVESVMPDLGHGKTGKHKKRKNIVATITKASEGFPGMKAHLIFGILSPVKSRSVTSFSIKATFKADLLHIIPVGDDTVLDGVLEGKDTSLGLGFVSDVAVLLAHTDHHTLVAGTADNGGEDGAGSVITGETGFAHTGAIVYDKSGNVVVTHIGNWEEIKSSTRQSEGENEVMSQSTGRPSSFVGFSVYGVARHTYTHAVVAISMGFLEMYGAVVDAPAPALSRIWPILDAQCNVIQGASSRQGVACKLGRRRLDAYMYLCHTTYKVRVIHLAFSAGGRGGACLVMIPDLRPRENAVFYGSLLRRLPQAQHATCMAALLAPPPRPSLHASDRISQACPPCWLPSSVPARSKLAGCRVDSPGLCTGVVRIAPQIYRYAVLRCAQRGTL